MLRESQARGLNWLSFILHSDRRPGNRMLWEPDAIEMAATYFRNPMPWEPNRCWTPVSWGRWMRLESVKPGGPQQQCTVFTSFNANRQTLMAGGHAPVRSLKVGQNAENRERSMFKPAVVDVRDTLLLKRFCLDRSGRGALQLECQQACHFPLHSVSKLSSKRQARR